MTTELTHEQAWKLRFGICDGYTIEFFEIDERNHITGLTDAGREALALYDAKWRTVEVKALSALVELAKEQLKSIDATYAGYHARLDKYGWLLTAIAKMEEVMK